MTAWRNWSGSTRPVSRVHRLLADERSEGLLEEARRAVKDLGAVGVQIFTNVIGRPLDRPETMPLFDLMAELDRPIWMHPARGADFPDYKGEPKSHYEIWWTFGWPYETSVAMAHLVFSGLFDRHPDLKIITHHLGGMIPYFEGRVGPGWDQLGARTSDEDYSLVEEAEEETPRLLSPLLCGYRRLRREGGHGLRFEVLRRGQGPLRLGLAL